MKRTLLVIAFLATAIAGSAAAKDSIDLDAYAKCITLATSKEPPPPEADQVCLKPARQGLPGAEYALGAILLSRQEYPDAIQWLERAAKADNPPAAYLLAEIYLGSQDSDLEKRGRELLEFAICSGYPPAQGSQSRAALGELKCSSAERKPFDGSWSATLDWVKQTPGVGNADGLKIVLSGDAAKVLLQSGESWVEFKPGKFRAEQVDETLIVSATDSGWDFDGKWIESWTVQLLRTSPDQADLVVLRTVNNVYVPESTGLRTFATMAQGHASCESP